MIWKTSRIYRVAGAAALGILSLAFPEIAWAQSGPVTQLQQTALWIAKTFQAGAMAMGVAGLIVIAAKAARGKSPIDSGFSWLGAMFVLSVAGHLVEFFTDTNPFTEIQGSHIEGPDIYGAMQEEIARGGTGAPGSGSIWGPNDNVFGDAPGSGTIWPTQAVGSAPPGAIPAAVPPGSPGAPAPFPSGPPGPPGPTGPGGSARPGSPGSAGPGGSPVPPGGGSGPIADPVGGSGSGSGAG